jgi:S-(hydroxymethyl)glutathione dehydrogenase/alcohol dehydrogenase
MKAAVFHKPGDISYDTVDDPRIEDGRDVILKVTATANVQLAAADASFASGQVYGSSGGVGQP